MGIIFSPNGWQDIDIGLSIAIQNRGLLDRAAICVGPVSFATIKDELTHSSKKFSILIYPIFVQTFV